jgi:hypothetical protein
MNNIPSIGSSTELTEPKAQPKAQNFKGSQIKTLLTDELMFDSEFDMTVLTTALPPRGALVDSNDRPDQPWDFDQVISQIYAEQNASKCEKK